MFAPLDPGEMEWQCAIAAQILEQVAQDVVPVMAPLLRRRLPHTSHRSGLNGRQPPSW